MSNTTTEEKTSQQEQEGGNADTVSKTNSQSSQTSRAKSSLSKGKISQQESEKQKKKKLMAKLMKEVQTPPQEGDIVEGPVITKDKNQVFIDLQPFGTGIIYGKEFMNARDVLQKVTPDERISAKVVEPENKNGYIELSLKEARQAFIWNEAEEAIKNKTIFELPVKEANKGGLILEWQGVPGFLPASQLKEEHYPHVEEGDKNKIYEELKKLAGEKLLVSIISTDFEEEKLIFSEKELDEKERKEMVSKYQMGDVVEGEITGIVDFGAFVKVEEGLEGLIHISEIDWGLVEDPRQFFKEGDTVQAKIIDIQDNKISLSTKALKENPWEDAAEKYSKGDIVTGVVIKYNDYGALASIEEGVAGLIHISEFNSEEELKSSLELGKTYSFKITHFEPKERKMTLSHKEADKQQDDSDLEDSEEKKKENQQEETPNKSENSNEAEE